MDYQGKKVPFGEMPVGNGPFKMSEPWKHNQYIKVVRNDDYYGDEGEPRRRRRSRSSRTRRPPTPSSRRATSTSPRSRRQDQGRRRDQYGESPDGYTVNPGKQVLLGAENATYYLILNNKDQYIEEPERPQGHQPGHQPPGDLRHRLRGHARAGRQHRSAGHRRLREGRLGRRQVRRRGAPRRRSPTPATPRARVSRRSSCRSTAAAATRRSWSSSRPT